MGHKDKPRELPTEGEHHALSTEERLKGEKNADGKETERRRDQINKKAEAE